MKRVGVFFYLIPESIGYLVLMLLFRRGSLRREGAWAIAASGWRYVFTGEEYMTEPELDATYNLAVAMGDREMAQKLLDSYDAAHAND